MRLADKGTPAELAKAITPQSSWQIIEELAEVLELAIKRREIASAWEERPYSAYSPKHGRWIQQTLPPARVAMLADAAKWAHEHGFQVDPRLAKLLSLQSPSSVEIESAETVVDESPKKNPTHPKLLTTPDIGRAFNGINGWDAEKWAKNIGKAEWAKPAKTDGGGKPKPDLWHPIELAKCLLKKNDDAESESLVKAFDKAFRTHRLLADWKNEWANYAEHWEINPPI